MRRQFETVETAEGTRYLLDGKEICHVVGCELELLSAKHSRYLMTLKVAVANYSYRENTETGEEDSSYHQLRVQLVGDYNGEVYLDDLDMLTGLVGFGFLAYTKEHGNLRDVCENGRGNSEKIHKERRNDSTGRSAESRMRAETARRGPSVEEWPLRTDDGRPKVGEQVGN